MPYSVSSGFLSEAGKTTPTIVRKFMIGSSDYSDKVTRWPKIRKVWNDIRPAAMTIVTLDHDRQMSFFRDNPVTLRSTVTVEMGFTVAGSDELVTLFSGTVDRVKYNKGQCEISLQDKIKPLTEKVIGSSDVPAEFTSSDYNPADLAWYLVSSFGGLGTGVFSTNNPDVDYTSWLNWWTMFDGDSVLVNARYEGKKVNEALRSIGRYTASTISVEDDKLTFNRYTAIASYSTSLGADIIANDLVVDDKMIINTQHVYADYDPTSDYWKLDAIAVNTASVNSYGTREQIEKDKTIWYSNSVSALNFSQRQLTVNATPFNQYKLTTPLTAIARQLGESVTFEDSFFQEGGVTQFRIMEYEIDMDNGVMHLSVDGSQSLVPFVLDDAVNGLLDEAYNFLL